MNYYPFHIGDFRSGTANMSRLQRAIYRDLLDIYYDTEKPLPLDLEEVFESVGASSDEERRIVERLLRFKFDKQDDGYHHEICEKVIGEYHAKAETAKSNGKLGGRPPKAKPNPNKPSGLSVGTGSEPDRNPIATGSQANQEPITNNQEPEKVKSIGQKRGASASRLPADWLPTDGDAEYCKTKRPDLLLTDVADRFRDYWLGSGGKKVDWNATWRSWVQNERRGQVAGPPGFQTANEKAKSWADRITGKTRHEHPDQNIIDLNAPP